MKDIYTLLLLFSFAFWQGQPFSVDEGQRQFMHTATTSQSAKTIDTTSGMIYFSFDNGATWVDQSKGLPAPIRLTDMAVGDNRLGIATKQHGIFLFDESASSWKAVAGKPPTTANVDALYFHGNNLFVGTEGSGVFISKDEGRTWTTYNRGLHNLTIRKFAVVFNKLYAGTNGGLYFLNESQNTWVLAYQSSSLQVNGITEYGGDLYAASNRGAFRAANGENVWREIMPNQALYNISSDNRTVYALAYSGLFASSDKGVTWQSIQKGLPEGLYSFQLLQKDNTILVGQWDGIYKRQPSPDWSPARKEWVLWSHGLPEDFAVTEMKAFKNSIVIGCSERKLRKGISIKR